MSHFSIDIEAYNIPTSIIKSEYKRRECINDILSAASDKQIEDEYNNRDLYLTWVVDHIKLIEDIRYRGMHEKIPELLELIFDEYGKIK